MTDLATVSVVVPTYNHERFVERAIRSVADQTYEGPIELIIVDDGSSDRTFDATRSIVDVVRRERRWDSIVVERNASNRGAHATITDAIARTHGEFVTILNSDDAYSPTRLEEILAAMRSSGSAFGFSLTRSVDDDGRDIPFDAISWRIGEFALASAECLPSIEFGFLRHNLAVSTGNMIFARALYDRIGGFAPLRYVHDWDFALAAVLLTRPCFVARRLYDYRIHGSNSFASLGHVAETETDAVMLRYFRRISAGRVENPLAATPRNFPGVFEHYLHRFGLYRSWADFTSAHTRYALR